MERTIVAGRPTSRIGFGCGRLVGGAGARASAKLVETALTLGIRHFDVAPSYGLGLAENVLGDVLASVPEATIITKAGIARPGNAGLKSIARQLLRPLLAATPGLKAKLARQAGGVSRGQFEPAQVEASLTDSLSRLRRDRVDAFLLHQPAPVDLTPGLEAVMAQAMVDGRVGAVGSGSNDDVAAVVPFGTVRQYRFDVAATYGKGDDGLILHGVMRRYPTPPTFSPEQRDLLQSLGRDPRDPLAWTGIALTLALRSAPEAVLLISSTSADRLCVAVEAIDWSADEAQVAVMQRLIV